MNTRPTPQDATPLNAATPNAARGAAAPNAAPNAATPDAAQNAAALTRCKQCRLG